MNSSPLSSASWIASPLVGGPRVGVPVPYLRKSFTLTHPVKSARLSITALGLYEAEINGRRIGEQVFAPGWTDYRKRVYYQTHDVTALLRDGENVLGAILGDGWYCGFLGWAGRQNYGDRPQLRARLEVDYADGSSFSLETDASWKTTTGPILQADLLMGETYDARLELAGWSEPGYADAQWLPVIVTEAPAIALEVSPGPPVCRIEELSPRKQPGAGHIFDFDQNFSGRVRIAVKAPRGRTLTLRFAEILNPDGTLYRENLRGARVEDFYTCKGGEIETWEPLFTFHGFRYVEVWGLAPEDFLEITGIVLHSDTPPTGVFRCSHPLLNQLQHNIIWGQKSNFLEVPTDCPQRDERLGWTGDAQVFIRTAAFNMNVQAFFRKWTQDLRDAQGERGGVPPVIPACEAAIGMEDGGPAWADATIICPWTVYLCYGDREILAQHYGSMQRFMDFLAEHRCLGRIRSHPDVDSWGGFGDWLALDGSGKTEGGTARDLIGTAFYAYDAELMAKIAAVLGREEDARAYRALHGEIVEAFRRRFVTPDGLMAGGTQTSYVLALRFGLIPKESRATAATELVRDIQRRDYHLATGFVGTPYLLDVLADHGHLDIAYKLLEQETFPSWLFPVTNGATTIWERWDGWTPDKGFQDKTMNSFNHYAYGAVGAWMYRVMAGLELDEAEPGYRHILFQPRPGGSITWAEARLETLQGEAAIRWDRKGDGYEAEITVPANSRATFVFPRGNEPQGFGPGQYRVSFVV